MKFNRHQILRRVKHKKEKSTSRIKKDWKRVQERRGKLELVSMNHWVSRRQGLWPLDNNNAV